MLKLKLIQLLGAGEKFPLLRYCYWGVRSWCYDQTIKKCRGIFQVSFPCACYVWTGNPIQQRSDRETLSAKNLPERWSFNHSCFPSLPLQCRLDFMPFCEPAFLVTRQKEVNNRTPKTAGNQAKLHCNPQLIWSALLNDLRTTEVEFCARVFLSVSSHSALYPVPLINVYRSLWGKKKEVWSCSLACFADVLCERLARRAQRQFALWQHDRKNTDIPKN